MPFSILTIVILISAYQAVEFFIYNVASIHFQYSHTVLCYYVICYSWKSDCISHREHQLFSSLSLLEDQSILKVRKQFHAL